MVADTERAYCQRQEAASLTSTTTKLLYIQRG